MIKDILIAQKRELEEKLKEQYIERKGDHKKLKSPLIKVIIGPRRAGKSFFAIHFLKRAGNFGYVNFDDERLLEVRDYDEIISAVNSVYKNPKRLLFDEIQNLLKWELFANRLQRQGCNLVITGSNSKLLSRELATHLTGRHSLLHLFPFSFREILDHEKSELTTLEIKERLADYIQYGGYPEPFVKNLDRREYLSTLFSSIIYKDIVKRHKIRFPQGMENLASFLLTNISQEYSYNSLARLTNVQSVHTIEKYLGYLEESFIFFRVNRFSYKLREQFSASKKIYCIDNGFFYSKAFRISPDIGKLYENVVAVELKKREMSGNSRVFFWKNAQREEVDFVVMEGMKAKTLIQVCRNPENADTKKREVRALLKASAELKCRQLIIITENIEKEEPAEWFGTRGRIKYIPLWKWLLGQ